MTISVDAVVYYRVSNSTLCKTSVENAHHSTMLLSQVDIFYDHHDYHDIDQNDCMNQFQHDFLINHHYYHHK